MDFKIHICIPEKLLGATVQKILHAIDMLDNSKNRHEETERQIHKRKDIISAAQLGGGGGVGLDL